MSTPSAPIDYDPPVDVQRRMVKAQIDAVKTQRFEQKLILVKLQSDTSGDDLGDVIGETEKNIKKLADAIDGLYGILPAEDAPTPTEDAPAS